jgi:hypothetical protein
MTLHIEMVQINLKVMFWMSYFFSGVHILLKKVENLAQDNQKNHRHGIGIEKSKSMRSRILNIADYYLVRPFLANQIWVYSNIREGQHRFLKNFDHKIWRIAWKTQVFF